MELSSAEDTTQGCPLSMAMYALSVLPLIDPCRDTAKDGCGSTKQIWYADDEAAGGRLTDLSKFWDILVKDGPAYAYFPKPSKTFLVIKSGCHADGEHIFADTGVQLTEYGQRHLGAPIGSDEFVA